MCCLSTGLIPETYEAEPEDPSSIFTEMKQHDWEADCWISDVADIGGDHDLPIYHDEFKEANFQKVIITVPFIIMRLQEMHSVKDMNIF